MGQPVARINDIVVGRCEANTSGHPRDFVGTWVTGSDVVDADGIPVVRVGDIGICDCGHTFIAVEGSNIATADELAIHRVGDIVIVVEGGVGVTVTGSDSTDAE